MCAVTRACARAADNVSTSWHDKDKEPLTTPTRRINPCHAPSPRSRRRNACSSPRTSSSFRPSYVWARRAGRNASPFSAAWSRSPWPRRSSRFPRRTPKARPRRPSPFPSWRRRTALSWAPSGAAVGRPGTRAGRGGRKGRSLRAQAASPPCHTTAGGRPRMCPGRLAATGSGRALGSPRVPCQEPVRARPGPGRRWACRWPCTPSGPGTSQGLAARPDPPRPTRVCAPRYQRYHPRCPGRRSPSLGREHQGQE
mmetsp:Transcript_17504/g.61177  ORF Transcript_17504/g.61177 Transcript_17504/m.61177 type:complete len:254 (+) Transcript_17504:144-905(+)